jgi:hypothetical protein
MEHPTALIYTLENCNIKRSFRGRRNLILESSALPASLNKRFHVPSP